MSRGAFVTPRSSPSTGARIGAFFLGAVAIATAFCARAEDDGGKVMVQFAPSTLHYHSRPDYANTTSWLVGAEYQRRDRYLAGYAYFNNSFDQRSHYAYGGRTWMLGAGDTSYWYFKLTGGVIVGYREPYENKIPFNHNGVAPGIVPGVGYQYERFNAQLNVLGGAGVMFTFGYDLFL
jgi:hypothetical protein